MGDDITIKFFALESAKTSDSKIPKRQNDALGDALEKALENRILDELRTDAEMNQKDLAEKLQISRTSVQKAMNRLKESGRIVRKGGRRFGYWENVKTLDPKASIHQSEALEDALGEALENRILDELRTDAGMNQRDLAVRLQISRTSVQKAMNRLKESGRIIRKGGRRFGYWEIQSDHTN